MNIPRIPIPTVRSICGNWGLPEVRMLPGWWCQPRPNWLRWDSSQNVGPLEYRLVFHYGHPSVIQFPIARICIVCFFTLSNKICIMWFYSIKISVLCKFFWQFFSSILWLLSREFHLTRFSGCHDLCINWEMTYNFYTYIHIFIQV